MIPTHGGDLARIWRPEHSRNSLCPRCGNSINSVGLPELVFTFESCGCDEASYTHLTETVWHGVCFVIDRAADPFAGGSK